MNIKHIILSIGLFFIASSSVLAAPISTARYFNGPSVRNITSTTAEVFLSSEVLSGMSIDDGIAPEDKSRVYFEYRETEQVCIMIYPTPANCLPKKTAPGQFSVTLTDLKPNTSYTVTYKKDNTINCVMAPCPSNEVTSLSRTFTTTGATIGTTMSFNRNLGYGSRGTDVRSLQIFLKSQGYMSASDTGFFGIATFKGVKAFQKGYMRISPTGFVGVKTRAVLNAMNVPATITAEYFSGTVQAVSTGCFSDGICSITIDGKKVVTTIGWSQAIVGSIKGSVSSVGDAEGKIGHMANVYAQKTDDGYTLYGNSAYYIDIQ